VCGAALRWQERYRDGWVFVCSGRCELSVEGRLRYDIAAAFAGAPRIKLPYNAGIPFEMKVKPGTCPTCRRPYVDPVYGPAFSVAPVTFTREEVERAQAAMPPFEDFYKERMRDTVDSIVRALSWR
jgi:hypothetical protein